MIENKIIEIENRYGKLADSIGPSRYYTCRYTSWTDRYYVDDEKEAMRRILHSIKTYSASELKLSQEHNDAAVITTSGTGLYWGLIPLAGSSKDYENKKIESIKRMLEGLLSVGIDTVIVKTSVLSRGELGTLISGMYKSGWSNTDIIVEDPPKNKCRTYLKFTREDNI